MAGTWSGTKSTHLLEIGVSDDAMQRLLKIQAASGLLTANLEVALDECALELASSMESYMHFDQGYATGELESSIETQTPAPLQRKIGSASEHAAFVEFGTGQRGAASGLTPPQSYAYGQNAGMLAQPYMTPALEEHVPVIKHLIEDAIADTLAGLVF